MVYYISIESFAVFSGFLLFSTMFYVFVVYFTVYSNCVSSSFLDAQRVILNASTVSSKYKINYVPLNFATF